jgi:hypothetical protein
LRARHRHGDFALSGFFSVHFWIPFS